MISVHLCPFELPFKQIVGQGGGDAAPIEGKGQDDDGHQYADQVVFGLLPCYSSVCIVFTAGVRSMTVLWLGHIMSPFPRSTFVDILTLLDIILV